MTSVVSEARRGYALAFLSAMILSTTGVFIRHLTEACHMPALVLAFWRAGFAAGTLLVVLGALKPSLLVVGLRDLGFLALYGLVLAGFNATWTLAVALTGASLSTVLVNMSAAFTAVLGWWLLRERLGWGTCLAVGLSLAGCAIISRASGAGPGRIPILGLVLGVVSALCYASYSLMGRMASRRGLHPWTVVFYTFAFSCLILALLNGLQTLPGSGAWLVLGRSGVGWFWLFTLAAGPTVIGFGLYNASLNHLPSSVANLIVTTEPVFTALLAYRIFGERLDGAQLIGCALVLGGVVLLRITERGARVTPRVGTQAPLAMGISDD